MGGGNSIHHRLKPRWCHVKILATFRVEFFRHAPGGYANHGYLFIGDEPMPCVVEVCQFDHGFERSFGFRIHWPGKNQPLRDLGSSAAGACNDTGDRNVWWNSYGNQGAARGRPMRDIIDAMGQSARRFLSGNGYEIRNWAEVKPPDDIHTDSPQMIATAREVVERLVDVRDFLGYQLSHATGMMDDVAFGEIADKYLLADPGVDMNVSAIAIKIALLARLLRKTPQQVGAELVSTVFCCNIDVAQQAIEEAEKK